MRCPPFLLDPPDWIASSLNLKKKKKISLIDLRTFYMINMLNLDSNYWTHDRTHEVDLLNSHSRSASCIRESSSCRYVCRFFSTWIFRLTELFSSDRILLYRTFTSCTNISSGCMMNWKPWENGSNWNTAVITEGTGKQKDKKRCKR